MLGELTDVLSRPKFNGRIQRAGLTREALIDAYSGIAEVVVPAAIPRTVTVDPDDDMVLAAAVGGGADLVVSGNRDLLDLGQFRRHRILTVRQALEVVAQMAD